MRRTICGQITEKASTERPVRKLACLRVRLLLNVSINSVWVVNERTWFSDRGKVYSISHSYSRMPFFYRNASDKNETKWNWMFPQCIGGSARMINYFHQICVHVHVPSPFIVDAVRESKLSNASTTIHHILYMSLVFSLPALFRSCASPLTR